MALKATIFKAELQISNVDRHYYEDHALTIARHPSETDERMMVRVLAFALHAHPALAFGKGIGTDDEPDLWQKDLTGAVDLWTTGASGAPAGGPAGSPCTPTAATAWTPGGIGSSRPSSGRRTSP
jgi:uncharacterized protein YaeQ